MLNDATEIYDPVYVNRHMCAMCDLAANGDHIIINQNVERLFPHFGL